MQRIEEQRKHQALRERQVLAEAAERSSSLAIRARAEEKQLRRARIYAVNAIMREWEERQFAAYDRRMREEGQPGGSDAGRCAGLGV